MDFTAAKPQTRTAGTKMVSFDEVFDRGYMNFTHFIHADVYLESLTCLIFAYAAATAGGAATCIWDTLLHVHFGDLEEDFNPAHASAILIQVN
jgi:hypothetical protein